MRKCSKNFGVELRVKLEEDRRSHQERKEEEEWRKMEMKHPGSCIPGAYEDYSRSLAGLQLSSPRPSPVRCYALLVVLILGIVELVEAANQFHWPGSWWAVRWGCAVWKD